jgi:hypothetical protein
MAERGFRAVRAGKSAQKSSHRVPRESPHPLLMLGGPKRETHPLGYRDWSLAIPHEPESLTQWFGCAHLSLGDLDVLWGAACFTFSVTKRRRPLTPHRRVERLHALRIQAIGGFGAIESGDGASSRCHASDTYTGSKEEGRGGFRDCGDCCGRIERGRVIGRRGFSSCCERDSDDSSAGMKTKVIPLTTFDPRLHRDIALRTPSRLGSAAPGSCPVEFEFQTHLSSRQRSAARNLE